MTERKNINRGYKKLEVWKLSIELYVVIFKLFSKFPFELKKTAANIIDSSHSLSRNIAEGYCRKGLKEYLNFLNIALASCGELHSSYCACKAAGQITEEEFEMIDVLHYKFENYLISLIESLQKKAMQNDWVESFIE